MGNLDVELGVTFILKFNLRKRQCQVKLGQILKSKIFLLQMRNLTSLVSGNKNVIYFDLQ